MSISITDRAASRGCRDRRADVHPDGVVRGVVRSRRVAGRQAVSDRRRALATMDCTAAGRDAGHDAGRVVVHDAGRDVVHGRVDCDDRDAHVHDP